MNIMKFFVNFSLTFAVIGFITYLLIVIASFFGCCVGLTDFMYQKIILALVIIGTITFGVCMYNNCSKHLKNKN